MRIISGAFRGKKIILPLDKNTRPLKDITKESIFNIIKHSKKFNIDFENAYILDLFSGIGSFGIECISRGAKFVTFVENYLKVILILKKNLSNLKILNYEILTFDIANSLTKQQLDKKYDIIFLDPPYKEKNPNKIIENILNNKILNEGGMIIIHRHKKEKDNFTEKFKILEVKLYGISKVIFGTF